MEENRKRGALSVNMTEGSLWKNMLLFSLPLMMTQVLEVLFNLSDVAIAGKFADYRALGAVGSTTLLVSLFTGLLIGMGSGVNVAVARGLGMGDRERRGKDGPHVLRAVRRLRHHCVPDLHTAGRSYADHAAYQGRAD